MLHALRHALLPVVVLGVASALSGCKSDCETKDGVTTCEGITTTQYTGSPTAIEVPWQSGQPLRVGVAGGNVRVNDATKSIQIRAPGVALPAGCSDTSKICVVFTPINNDAADNKAEAQRQMGTVAQGGNLVLTAVNDDTEARVTVNLDKTNGGSYNSSLSALVYVVLPTGFDGDIIAVSTHGDLIIEGSRRGLVAYSGDRAGNNPGIGQIDVVLGAPIPAGNNTIERTATTGSGTINFTAPLAANISVQGYIGGTGATEVVRLWDEPAGWQQVAGSTEQSATFCGNAACSGGITEGSWSLTTNSGDINIYAK